MKFLCPQCKAKYQIADEKLEGRALRMRCRKCETDIVIRNGAVSAANEAEQVAPPLPSSGTAGRAKLPAPPSRGGSGMGPLPRKPSVSRPMSIPAPSTTAARKPASPLSTDFRRQMASEAPLAKTSTGALDQWHVSINDIPVGPMKREELQKKVASGAVSGDSLAWREGYDDWRPLKDIPELSPLLRRSVPPPGPGAAAGRAPLGSRVPMPRSVAPATPGPGPRGVGLGSRLPAAPIPRPSIAARSNVVPIGGRLGAAAAPAVDDVMPSIAPSTIEPAMDELASISIAPPVQLPASAPVPQMAPAPVAASFAAPVAAKSIDTRTSEPPVERSSSSRRSSSRSAPKQNQGLVIFIAVVGGLLLAGIGAVVGIKFIGSKPTAAELQAQAAQQQEIENLRAQLAAAQGSNSAADPRIAELEARIARLQNAQANPNPTQVAVAEEATKQGSARTRPTTNAAANNNAALSAEAAAQAERDRQELAAAIAAGGGGTGPANLAVGSRPVNIGDDRPAPSSGGQDMSGEQVQGVVRRNRTTVQTCYERFARAEGATEAVRVKLHVVAGSSGRGQVTALEGPSSLTSCMITEVRRWMWPGSGEFDLPFVFQPGQ